MIIIVVLSLLLHVGWEITGLFILLCSKYFPPALMLIASFPFTLLSKAH